MSRYRSDWFFSSGVGELDGIMNSEVQKRHFGYKPPEINEEMIPLSEYFSVP